MLNWINSGRGGPLGHLRPLALTAILSVAVCVSACASSTPALNTSRVQQAIGGSILSEHHLHATVTCPKVPAQAGRVFTCAARLGAGAYPVTVTETNASGHVRYVNPTPLAVLDVARVEAAIR